MLARRSTWRRAQPRHQDDDLLGRRSQLEPTPAPLLLPRRAQPQPPPPQRDKKRRWEHGNPCPACSTTTVLSTYYVDEHGQSTTCTTTEYEETTITTTQATHPATTTTPYYTVMQTMTSTLYNIPSATPTYVASLPSSAVPQKAIQLDGQICDCQRQWFHLLLGGVPHGAAEVIACVVFFFPFLLFLLCSLARLYKYAGVRTIFFALLPFTVFLATMVAALPTRAFAATNDSTNHVLAQNFMLAIAAPMAMEMALQVYGLLRKRAEPSGWIDATSLFLRLLNVAALVLYAVSSSQFVTFVHGWQNGTLSCATSTPGQIATLQIVADFIELGVLVLGFFFLFWARWRLRMQMPVLIIQAHIYALLFVFFIWRTARDIGATTAWSRRQDRKCAPLGQVYGNGGSDSSGVFYYYLIPWSAVHGLSPHGLDGQAAFWLLGILPLLLATCILMAVNLVVYSEAEPDIMPQPDSARYKLCYNEDSKKMEFVRLDNPGGPRLATGEQLYEIVRDDDGDGWEVREARIPTVLPISHHVTFRPWYR